MSGAMNLRPAEVRVDLAAIRHNVGLLAARAPDSEVLVAVKADGYGHGLVEAARASLDGGAHRLGVAFVREALDLRAAGVTAPILAWILPPGEPLAEAARHGVELSAWAPWVIDEIVAGARAAGRPVRIHLKVDTGLSRGGAPAAAWDDLVRHALKAQAEGFVEVVGLWSHFACADEPGHPSNQSQLTAFAEAIRTAESAGVNGAVRHIANSAAILTLPGSHYDMIRPGVAAYGLTPIPELGSFGLEPAMTLTARLALVKRVPAGSGVSYGHQYVTSRETTLGLVPLGYADGIARAVSNRGQVLAGGARRTIAGRVCMDQFMLDFGDDAVAEGDEVIVFGPGRDNEPTCLEWADYLGTITYEIVTRIGSRVPRVHLNDLRAQPVARREER